MRLGILIFSLISLYRQPWPRLDSTPELQPDSGWAPVLPPPRPCGVMPRSNTSNHENEKSKYELLLTDFGWNHRNKTRGLEFSRYVRSTEFLDSLLRHEHFEPLGWETLISGERQLDPETRYYVFLDVETCHESNYPLYGKDRKANLDRSGGRSGEGDSFRECYNIQDCSILQQALTSTVFRNASYHGQVTLMYFDCRGTSPGNHIRRQFRDYPISFASLSAHASQLSEYWDQGLPPPSVKRIHVDDSHRNAIEECSVKDRPHHLSFIGNIRNRRAPVRRWLSRLNRPPEVLMIDSKQYVNASYEELLLHSRYGAVPRGDNLFSYRFTEVLSAGAIPIVYADGWSLPFMDTVVDWTKCALVIPEKNAKRTLQYISQISAQEECERRKYCFSAYSRNMKSPSAILNGLLQGLENSAEERRRLGSRHPKPVPGV